ncbi:MAG: DUF4351 domain-containing protein [Cyanobacteria bacterium P01_F01_bin.150]
MTDNRNNYDAPWKEAIELYFHEFMDFFFPALEPQIDWQRPYEFLDKELQQIVRDADLGRRWADKLVKVWLVDGAEAWILIRIEVQSQYQTDFAQRMYRYNYRLNDRYNRSVASLAILADDRPSWKPKSYKKDTLGTQINFTFSIAKLLDFDQNWTDLETNLNPFSIVVMAHLKARETKDDPPSRKEWKLRLTRRLYEQGYSRSDILELYRFIDWLIVLPEPLETIFQQELDQYEREGTMRYVSTIERQGIAKGIEQGIERERSLILRQLTRRVGELPESIIEPINQLSVDDLEALGEALLDFEQMDDLQQWLTEYQQRNQAEDEDGQED